jgi:stage V sporulation protein K
MLMLDLALIQNITTEIPIKMMMLEVLSFLDAKSIYQLALRININKMLNKIYEELPDRTENEKTDQQIEAAKEWLYKTEFDDQGNILHCNAYSSSVFLQKTNETKEDDDDNLLYELTMKELQKKECETMEHYSAVQYSAPSQVNGNQDKRKDLEEGLRELKEIVGLQPVKEFVYELKDMIELNRERQKVGQYVGKQNLHMIFQGNPGTGKTTVARIIGKIMRGLQVIDKGHFIEVSREDLVADYIGGSAKKTREVLTQALGGVLFIDEAYSLASGGPNDFGKEAIHTLVKFIEDHNDELIVILAGYTNEMNELLKINPGLKSRFPNVIEFPDYKPEELLEIAKRMLKKKNFKLNEKAENALLEVLTKKQIGGRMDNGNGRLVRNVVQEAIRKQSKRLKSIPSKSQDDYFYLLPQDFGYEEETTFNLEEELNKVVGNKEIKDFVRALQAQVQIHKMRQKQGLPTKSHAYHMIFKGNPGTGKTTIARIMGKMLKELGVVKSGHVVEVTREDLVAGYVGQSAPKTKEKIKEALGGILFIDEAYSLNRGGENDFGKEVIDTLVKYMEEYRDNLIVIIAGYEKEMDDFLKANSGLKSRFPYQFTFKDYTLAEMIELAHLMAREQGYIIPDNCYPDLLHALLKGVGKKEDGNGRFVRNVLEKAQMKLSYRVTAEKGVHATREDLQTFAPEDFHF